MAKASQLNRKCAYCSSDLQSEPNFCSVCGKPQPVSRDEDYFSAFSLDKAFSIDVQLLEKNFYTISRVLHPDRFSNDDQEVKIASTQRMSLINQAYLTLKDKDRRRAYLLGLMAVTIPQGQAAQAQLPALLAEDWFDLKEKASLEELENFEKKLIQEVDSVEKTITEFEAAFDLNPKGREPLLEIGKKLQEKNFLLSMQRDLKRMKMRLSK